MKKYACFVTYPFHLSSFLVELNEFLVDFQLRKTVPDSSSSYFTKTFLAIYLTKGSPMEVLALRDKNFPTKIVVPRFPIPELFEKRNFIVHCGASFRFFSAVCDKKNPAKNWKPPLCKKNFLEKTQNFSKHQRVSLSNMLSFTSGGELSRSLFVRFSETRMRRQKIQKVI